MALSVITGYTGTRHITPLMDASVWRGIFGLTDCILDSGDKCEGSMPSINEFQIKSGVISVRGYMCVGTFTSLPIDTCATGYSRRDSVCARYSKDASGLVTVDYVINKGQEVQDPNTPLPPPFYDDDFDTGAGTYDMVLYEITLRGSTVTFERRAEIYSFQRKLKEDSMQSIIVNQNYDRTITANPEVLLHILTADVGSSIKVAVSYLPGIYFITGQENDAPLANYAGAVLAIHVGTYVVCIAFLGNGYAYSRGFRKDTTYDSGWRQLNN